MGSASAAPAEDPFGGEPKFAVGFGEVGLPFRRARELWKNRIEERRRWRIVLLLEDGEAREFEENVKFVGCGWFRAGGFAL